MKRLSDYEGEEAILLWGELFDPMIELLSDDDITEAIRKKESTMFDVAKLALKKHPKELYTILKRVDDDKINAANVLTKVVVFLTELVTNGKATAFFNSAESGGEEKESSGSATENTEDGSK